jgi:hypothetical protein
MDLKLRPFNERFERGRGRSPLCIVGEIEAGAFVVDVDGTRVTIATRRIEHDEQGEIAWVPADQAFDLQLGRLLVVAQLVGSELLGAEIKVQLGGTSAVNESGFSVFFNLLGQVDGQGTVRGLSEPPVLN